jgi:bilirubin oxidase
MLVNGTINAKVNLPKQYVRLRILNVEMERGYNLGFSDNRTFYVIGNDGGLLNAPVSVTRVKLMVGERVEILVNLSGDAVGDSVNLMSYNSGQGPGYPGGEPSTTPPFGSLLNNIDFRILHIVVSPATSGGITALPSSLVSNTYLTAADATVTRTVNVTDGNPPNPFYLDHTPFNLTYINKTITLGTTEQWTVTNNNVFGHAFHIHDIEFKIISRSSGPVASYESGWKDTYFLHTNESVTFVARFDDYADPVHPFMYHCHFAPHEDAGMMGQFVVVDASGADNTVKIPFDVSVYPNPANNKIYILPTDASMKVYYVTVTDVSGRTRYMLPRPRLSEGIDISNFAPGIYFANVTDEQTKTTITKRFVKE